MKYMVKRFSQCVLMEEIVIEASSRKEALQHYLCFQPAFTAEDMGWPRRGDTLCIDIQEIIET